MSCEGEQGITLLTRLHHGEGNVTVFQMAKCITSIVHSAPQSLFHCFDFVSCAIMHWVSLSLSIMVKFVMRLRETDSLNAFSRLINFASDNLVLLVRAGPWNSPTLVEDSPMQQVPL